MGLVFLVSTHLGGLNTTDFSVKMELEARWTGGTFHIVPHDCKPGPWTPGRQTWSTDPKAHGAICRSWAWRCFDHPTEQLCMNYTTVDPKQVGQQRSIPKSIL